jgi:hypothetical protein
VGWFDFLKRGENPVERYADDVLGTMVWSPVEEAWRGECAGVSYLIAYDRTATPKRELLEYAREVLGEADTFSQSIAHELEAAAVKDTIHADEIRALTMASVSFYLHKGVRRMLVNLEGGRGPRAWRAEFRERNFEGIGYDD